MNIIENLVKKAQAIAWYEDEDMVIGRNNGQWIIRHIDDPEAEFLADNFVVCAAGVHPDYRDYFKALME